MKRSISFVLFFLLAAATAFATSYDLKKITPEIDRALKNRQARYAGLQNLKQSGLIGENSEGYVSSLKGDATAAMLVAKENADRKVIYHALVQQNGLGPDGMREVEKAFAEVQRDKASAGESIQSPAGDWVQK